MQTATTNLFSSRSKGRITRRSILRGAGVTMTLPLLDAMLSAARADSATEQTPRRMLAICTPYGIHAPQFVPQQAGFDYEPSPYLRALDEFRNELTLFSGLHHPDVDGGHSAELSFLTAAPHPKSASFKNTISVDQFAAERMGGQTRFPYLALATLDTRGLSWTRNGIQVPAENSPARLFNKLFLDGSREDKRAQVNRLREGRSILDTVRESARQLNRQLGPRDRDKLDRYYSSIRDLENELLKDEEWSRKPKPKVDASVPQDLADPANLIGRTRLMFDLAHLAFETDSTRLITIMVTGTFLVPPLDGVSEGHHPLSHHGNDPEKLRQMHQIESEQFDELRHLLAQLKSRRETNKTLLDRTMVLYGSNLGNANSHDTNNLPILLAGGGFKHGQHLAFDRRNNYPLPNLFVSMLQRLGIETDRFASSTGTMRGLELD
jgi:Protein of unknown function (DUF1552)